MIAPISPTISVPRKRDLTITELRFLNAVGTYVTYQRKPARCRLHPSASEFSQNFLPLPRRGRRLEERVDREPPLDDAADPLQARLPQLEEPEAQDGLDPAAFP